MEKIFESLIGKDCLVSVVVPFFNAEKTIERCAKSVLSQTYKNIELIFIDDGSNDFSAAICDKIVASDIRAKYYYQKNSGVSSARNHGISEAKGDYIIFIDSDDWIEIDAVYKLVFEAAHNGGQFVIPRMRIAELDKKSNTYNYSYDKDDYFLKIDNNYQDNFLELMKTGSLYSASGRLYDISLIKQGKIFFDEQIKVLEDFVFNLNFLFVCKTVIHIDYIAYNFYVESINEYPYRRNYNFYIDGINKSYETMRRFISYKLIPDNKEYYVCFYYQWINAIKALSHQEKNIIKKSLALRKISKSIKKQKLFFYCRDLMNVRYRVLCKPGSVLLFYIIVGLQYLKILLRKNNN